MPSSETPRVLSLSEVAERLSMKRPNVAKHLTRHGIAPAFAKAQGYFWWEADIEKHRKEREANKKKMAADAARRRSALRNRGLAENGAGPNLGPTERELLAALRQRPMQPDNDRVRSGLRRLRLRGYVSRVPGMAAEHWYELTPEGRTVAGRL